MADLKTTYMGIALENPVVAGASELTSNMDSIKKIEDAGAGALVVKSLFEEQIQLEAAKFDEEQSKYEGVDAELGRMFPDLQYAGPEEHLLWVRKAKEACSIPVIASLNAVNDSTWSEWAVKLEETGVDGLELNFFANPEKQEGEGASVEKDQIAVIKKVVSAVKIPVSVKMSLFYTAPVGAAKAFDKAGAAGLVLFNRFFQPDIDPDKEEHILPLNLSDASANRLPLRYAGLLYGGVEASICASGGIMDGSDAAKMILAGADVVQVVSTLYRNGVSRIGGIVDKLGEWMDSKGYASLDDFRGSMSREKGSDPWAYRRAQYAKLLMKPDPLALAG